MTAQGDSPLGKTFEVMVDHGVNVPVLCHRGMSLKQMVAWAGKVGGNFTPLFLYCRVPKLLDVK